MTLQRFSTVPETEEYPEAAHGRRVRRVEDDGVYITEPQDGYGDHMTPHQWIPVDEYVTCALCGAIKLGVDPEEYP